MAKARKAMAPPPARARIEKTHYNRPDSEDTPSCAGGDYNEKRSGYSQFVEALRKHGPVIETMIVLDYEADAKSGNEEGARESQDRVGATSAPGPSLVEVQSVYLDMLTFSRAERAEGGQSSPVDQTLGLRREHAAHASAEDRHAARSSAREPDPELR
jgi:hypothetical protein